MDKSRPNIDLPLVAIPAAALNPDGTLKGTWQYKKVKDRIISFLPWPTRKVSVWMFESEVPFDIPPKSRVELKFPPPPFIV